MLNFLDFYVGIGTVYTYRLTLIFEQSQIGAISGVKGPLNPDIFGNPLSEVSRGSISSIYTNTKVFGRIQGLRLRAVNPYRLTL